MARRMAETAAHLVDHVFPSLPVRQWVISFPKRLRYFLQRDPAVRSAALRIVLRVIEQALRERSPGASATAEIGAVAFIHHFGASLNEHTHFHICVIDGVFAGAQDDSPIAFFAAKPMDAPTVAAVQSTIRRRILRLFVRRGLLDGDDAKDRQAPGSTTAASPWMPRCVSRATTARVWSGCSGTALAHRSHWNASSGSTRSGSSTTCPSRPPTGRLASCSRRWNSSAAWRP